MTTEKALWIIAGLLTLFCIIAFDANVTSICTAKRCYAIFSVNKVW